MPADGSTFPGQVLDGIHALHQRTRDSAEHGCSQRQEKFDLATPNGAWRAARVATFGARFLTHCGRVLNRLDPPVVQRDEPDAHSLSVLDDGGLIHEVDPKIWPGIVQWARSGSGGSALER
jgi:hypothetical protein